MSRGQLPNMDISVGIGILVILTRRNKPLARDPHATELYDTSQLGPSMPELSFARLLRTDAARAKTKKKIVRYACRHMVAPRYLTMMDPMVPIRMQYCVIRGETRSRSEYSER
jgi:hypothetical protein